jgi:TolA-binding protein
MNSPHTRAEAAETSYAAGIERVAELERQIAALQHLVAELLVKNQQLRDQNLNTTGASMSRF